MLLKFNKGLSFNCHALIGFQVRRSGDDDDDGDGDDDDDDDDNDGDGVDDDEDYDDDDESLYVNSLLFQIIK